MLPTEQITYKLLIKALLNLFVASDMSADEATMRTVVYLLKETKNDKALINPVIDLIKELSSEVLAENDGLAVSVFDKPENVDKDWAIDPDKAV